MQVCDFGTLSIAGTVETEEGSGVENVEIQLNGEINQQQNTQVDGTYEFGNLEAGADYSISPYFDENPLNEEVLFGLFKVGCEVVAKGRDEELLGLILKEDVVLIEELVGLV